MNNAEYQADHGSVDHGSQDYLVYGELKLAAVRFAHAGL
jgi:hypothetical protein